VNQSKTISLSMLILGSISYAGGDSIPNEIDASALPTVSNTSNFYLGLGGSALKLKNDFTKENFKADTVTFAMNYRL